MHSINSRARRIAWERNQGASSAFNPFRRSHLHDPTTSDVEALGHIHHRVHQERPEPAQFGPPHHARTEPVTTHVELPAEADDNASLASVHTGQGRIQTTPIAELPTQTTPQPPNTVEHIYAEGGNEEIAVAVIHARRRRHGAGLIGLLLLPFIPIASLSIGPLSGAWSRVFSHLRESKIKYPIRQQLSKIFFNSWTHCLLLLIPAGFAIHYTRQNPIAVFFINFAAMVPSIMIMAFAVESILMYVGEIWGGLISMTFSNAAQLITSVLLLRSHQLGVLRTSLVGAILSNLLLMPGLGFLCGGWNRMEQFFSVTVAQTTSGMLLLALLSLMVPSSVSLLTDTTPSGIVEQSRGTAIILLICYGLYLFFQLKTHAAIYHEPPKHAEKRRIGHRKDVTREVMTMAESESDEEEEEEPELPLLTSLLVLAVFTALLTFNTLFATDSIQQLLLRLNISETFLGIVVLPIISNDPTTVLVAIKDRQDLMLGLTLGRCVRIALLVIPFIVLLAWMIGIDEMSLRFSGFETLIILAAVLVVNYIIQDGKSHWLVGALLVASYLIVSVSAYYIP